MCFFVIAKSMPYRQHALMQNAGNQNSPGLAPEENHMLALLPAIKAWANLVARTA